MKGEKVCINKSVALLAAVTVLVLGIVVFTNYVNTQNTAGNAKAASNTAACGDSKTISRTNNFTLYTAIANVDAGRGTTTLADALNANVGLLPQLCPGGDGTTTCLPEYEWNGKAGTLAKCYKKSGKVVSASTTAGSGVYYIGCGMSVEANMGNCEDQVQYVNGEEVTVGDISTRNATCPPTGANTPKPAFSWGPNGKCYEVLGEVMPTPILEDGRWRFGCQNEELADNSECCKLYWKESCIAAGGQTFWQCRVINGGTGDPQTPACEATAASYESLSACQTGLVSIADMLKTDSVTGMRCFATEAACNAVCK